MRLKYLGTSAAEGIPALFCSCTVCQRSRLAGGRNLRTRSQALIDRGKLLIDFPPDTYMHVLHHGLDLTKIHHCLLTHSHADHLYISDIATRQKWYAYFPKDEPFTLTFYATKSVCDKIQNELKPKMLESCHVCLQIVEPFKPFVVENYTVLPLEADHAPNTGPVIYAISDGTKRLLYGNDTGYFAENTWAYLERDKPRFDFVSLDCTGAIPGYRRGHMGIAVGMEVRERLLKIGCADERTIWCYHHFSHNGRATHDDLVPLATERGFLVSYDGMEIAI